MIKCIFLFLLIHLGESSYSQEIVDSSIVHLEKVIYFKSDAYELSEQDKADVLFLINNSDQCGSCHYYVDAHTDDVGSEDYNFKLSEKRKQSVVDFLKSNNISDSLISSNFHGESVKVAFKENEEARKLNRRAVVQLVSKTKFLYLNGSILDEETQEGISAEISIRTKNYQSKTQTDSIGAFKILAPLYSNVLLEVVAKDYFIETNMLKITERHKDLVLKIPLPKIAIGKRFRFKNLLFVGDKSIILPSSKDALAHLKRFMFLNEDQCIEIAGHINRPNVENVQTDTKHFQLSVARALAVHDALTDIGIDSPRILARGYGNWEMIYPKAKSESQMSKNRRVDIIMSECDSTRSIINHAIPNREEFSKLPHHLRYYSPKTFVEDTRKMPSAAVKQINTQLKKMKKARMDPTRYKYTEILKAAPELPKSK